MEILKQGSMNVARRSLKQNLKSPVNMFTLIIVLLLAVNSLYEAAYSCIAQSFDKSDLAELILVFFTEFKIIW